MEYGSVLYIVWDQFYTVGGFNGVAIAKAYDCNSSTANKGNVAIAA